MKKISSIFKHSVALFALLIFISSCASQKRYVYLDNMILGIEYEAIFNKKTTIRKDDRLTITIASKTPELAAPFNVLTGGVQLSDRAEINMGNNTATNTTGYLVDSQGNIDFPILGKLQVEGLTIEELKEVIRAKIIKGEYIKDPTVIADYANLKFYVLGEVASKGAHSMHGNRVTLLEAISQAGDVTPNGRPDRVAVIRRNGDINVKYMHDLQSKDIFSSPCFYLQQNDVIIVEARDKSGEKAVDNTLRYTSLIFSTISAGLALFVLLKK